MDAFFTCVKFILLCVVLYKILKSGRFKKRIHGIENTELPFCKEF